MANPIVKYNAGSKRSDHVDIIRACVNDDMICKLQAEDPQIEYRKLVGCYWTDELIDQVENVCEHVIMSQQLSSLHVTYDRMITLEHAALLAPLPATQLMFRVRQPSGTTKAWPQMMDSDPIARFNMCTETHDVALRIAETALNRGLLREVIMWLAEQCSSHEQAAYLLPGWVPMLRRAQMTGIANDIENCARPKKLPDVPPVMRQKLKWAHTFLAMHELLETFDKRVPRPDGHRCRIELADTKHVTGKIGDQMFHASFI